MSTDQHGLRSSRRQRLTGEGGPTVEVTSRQFVRTATLTALDGLDQFISGRLEPEPFEPRPVVAAARLADLGSVLQWLQNSSR